MLSVGVGVGSWVKEGGGTVQVKRDGGLKVDLGGKAYDDANVGGGRPCGSGMPAQESYSNDAMQAPTLSFNISIVSCLTTSPTDPVTRPDYTLHHTIHDLYQPHA